MAEIEYYRPISDQAWKLHDQAWSLYIERVWDYFDYKSAHVMSLMYPFAVALNWADVIHYALPNLACDNNDSEEFVILKSRLMHKTKQFIQDIIHECGGSKEVDAILTQFTKPKDEMVDQLVIKVNNTLKL